MTNYYATGRTNYFAVKDLEAFKAEMKPLTALRIEEREIEGEIAVALISDYEGGFVWDNYNAETQDDTELDWKDIFQRHLKDDWVAIITEAGSEGLRFVHGVALAYNNKGEMVNLYLNDIQSKALDAGLGKHITEPSY